MPERHIEYRVEPGDAVMVTGGRGYSDVNAVRDALAGLPAGTTIFHGGATGADALAASVAREMGLPTRHFPADWGLLGRRAGPIRNRAMLAERPVLVIAFPGGRGTADAVAAAQEAGVPVHRVQSRVVTEGDWKDET